MRRAVTAALGIMVAGWGLLAQADTTVMAVRIGATDVTALAKFYDTVFGLKQIDAVGTPPTEIIMRYGANAAAAKAGTSPEFLLQKREGAHADVMAHAIFRVTDIAASVAAAKAAGAKVAADTVEVPIGGVPVKVAMLNDPDGNVIELMELPKDLAALKHP